jgi:hypothetical protein
MEREDGNGGRALEGQLGLTRRNHPNIMVEVRTRPVRLLQRETGVGYVGVVPGRVCVVLSGREKLAMCHTMSELREENGHGKQGAQEEFRPTSSTVLTHRL